VSAVSTLISLIVFAIIGTAPLTAATFVGRRMGYRGIALVAPWGAAVAVGLLMGLAIMQLNAEVVSDGEPVGLSRVVSSWIGAIMLSGYFTTLVYLIVLAVRRLPTRPADTAAVF
jgi:hypothetical protein